MITGLHREIRKCKNTRFFLILRYRTIFVQRKLPESNWKIETRIAFVGKLRSLTLLTTFCIKQISIIESSWKIITLRISLSKRICISIHNPVKIIMSKSPRYRRRKYRFTGGILKAVKNPWNARTVLKRNVTQSMKVRPIETRTVVSRQRNNVKRTVDRPFRRSNVEFLFTWISKAISISYLSHKLHVRHFSCLCVTTCNKTSTFQSHTASYALGGAANTRRKKFPKVVVFWRTVYSRLDGGGEGGRDGTLKRKPGGKIGAWERGGRQLRLLVTAILLAKVALPTPEWATYEATPTDPSPPSPDI